MANPRGAKITKEIYIHTYSKYGPKVLDDGILMHLLTFQTSIGMFLSKATFRKTGLSPFSGKNPTRLRTIDTVSPYFRR
jgi:hypothetical protein